MQMRIIKILKDARKLIASSCSVAALLIVSDSACACSPNFVPQIQEAAAGEVVPSNAVFRCWYSTESVIAAKLMNEAGQRIPAELVSVRVPTPIFLDEPYCSELRPFQPLPAGKYTLQVQTDRGWGTPPVTFTVGTEADTQAPGGLQKLVATVKPVQVPVGVTASCSARVEARPFVVLEMALAIPPDDKTIPTESLVYELTSMPVVNGQPDNTRAQVISDIRLRSLHKPFFSQGALPNDHTLLVPVEWFNSLRDEESEVQLQLVAVDRAGNKSAPVATRITAKNLRETFEKRSETKGGRTGTEAVEFKPPPVPIDDALTKDLVRFREATTSTQAKEVFDVLQPLEPSSQGPEADAAFRRGILSREGEVPIQATIKGSVPVLVTMPAKVHAGQIFPALTRSDLDSFIESLPLSEPLVEKIEVDFRRRYNEKFWVFVTLKEGFGSKQYLWAPQETVSIKESLQKMMRWRHLLEEDAFYKAMVLKNGAPTGISMSTEETPTNPGSIGVGFSQATGMAYRVQDGKLEMVEFSGAMLNLQVAGLENPFKTIAQMLNLSDKEVAQMGVLAYSRRPEPGFAMSVSGSFTRDGRSEQVSRHFNVELNGPVQERK